MDKQPWLDERPVDRLLGGWRDLVEDLARLKQLISAADGLCPCGHTAGADPSCRCCEQVPRDLESVCETCNRQIAVIAPRMERLEEDTMRYLPAVLDLVVRTPDQYAQAVVVEHSFIRLLVTFRQLRAAAGDWANGCRITHLTVVKERSDEVAVACRHFEGALARVSRDA